MSDATARFALPYILPGQAQKEAFHNEALARVDIALHAAVEGMAATPPATPAEGACWIVAAGAAEAWAGKAGMLAGWTEGGWRFVEPRPGMRVWQGQEGYWVHWTGSTWNLGEMPVASLTIGGQQVVGPRQPEVPDPAGGTVVDAEARAAITAISEALRSHGLIE